MNIYLAMYRHGDIVVLAALAIGFALGAWLGYDHGREKGWDAGHRDGYQIGLALGKPHRDALGRFTK